MPVVRQGRNLAQASPRRLTARSSMPLRFSSASRSDLLPVLESFPAIIGIPIRKSIGIPISHREKMHSVNNLGQRIRGLRKTKGLTQAKLAKMAGIKQPSLSELETGESRLPAGDTLVLLAVALECNPEWLATGRGSPVATPSDIAPDEMALIYLWRQLSEEHQDLIMHMIERAAASKPAPKPTRARPFVKAS